MSVSGRTWHGHLLCVVDHQPDVMWHATVSTPVWSSPLPRFGAFSLPPFLSVSAYQRRPLQVNYNCGSVEWRQEPLESQPCPVTGFFSLITKGFEIYLCSADL